MGPNTPAPQGTKHWSSRFGGKLGDGTLMLALALAKLKELGSDGEAREAITAGRSYGFTLVDGDGEKHVRIAVLDGQPKPDTTIQALDDVSGKQRWGILGYMDSGTGIKVINFNGDPRQGLTVEDITLTMGYIGALQGAQLDSSSEIADVHFIGGDIDFSVVQINGDTRALDNVKILAVMPGYFLGALKKSGAFVAVAFDEVASIDQIDNPRLWQKLGGLASTDQIIYLGRVEPTDEGCFIAPMTIDQIDTRAEGKLVINPLDMSVNVTMNPGETRRVISARSLGSDGVVAVTDTTLGTLHFIEPDQLPPGFGDYTTAARLRYAEPPPAA